MYDLVQIQKYIARERPEGLIVDTNLLILFLMGKYQPEFITQCELTHSQGYTPEDYELLCAILKLFKQIIITPHIVAEVSNLSRLKLKDEKLSHYFKAFVELGNAAKESNVPLKNFLGMELKYIAAFGFTDMALYELAKANKLPIITDDGPLYQFASTHTPVIKFKLVKHAHLNGVFA